MKNTAKLYRMHTSEHICPFGLRSKYLLEKNNFEVEHHKLTSREEADKFKEKYNVKTTPQIFIDDERIGGYDELREYLGMDSVGHSGTTYRPVLVIFSMALLMSLATNFAYSVGFSAIDNIELFVAYSMIILAVQKLRDLWSFANSFITYDLVAMRNVRYAYVYPFAEAFSGIGMLATVSGFIVGPVSFFIGTVGAVSVLKAVYIDKRELKCACVGGDSNVPLGFVSLTENLFMSGAGIWMFLKAIAVHS